MGLIFNKNVRVTKISVNWCSVFKNFLAAGIQFNFYLILDFSFIGRNVLKHVILRSLIILSRKRTRLPKLRDSRVPRTKRTPVCEWTFVTFDRKDWTMLSCNETLKCTSRWNLGRNRDTPSKSWISDKRSADKQDCSFSENIATFEDISFKLGAIRHS